MSKGKPLPRFNPGDRVSVPGGHGATVLMVKEVTTYEYVVEQDTDGRLDVSVEDALCERRGDGRPWWLFTGAGYMSMDKFPEKAKCAECGDMLYLGTSTMYFYTGVYCCRTCLESMITRGIGPLGKPKDAHG